MPDTPTAPEAKPVATGASPGNATAAPAADETVKSLLSGEDAGKETAQAKESPATAKDAPSASAGEIKLVPPKDSGLTDADAAQVVEFAKAHGLTQAQAEKILERDAQGNAIRAKAQEEQAKANQAEYLKHLNKIAAEGAQKFKNDPEFGGQNFEASVRDANKVVAKYWPEPFQKWLQSDPHGKALANDPMFLQGLARLGKGLREDNPGGAESARAPAPSQPLSTRWYGPGGTPKG